MICKDCAEDADYQTGAPAPAGGWTSHAGHEDCKGCDCQHKPVKAGQISG